MPLRAACALASRRSIERQSRHRSKRLPAHRRRPRMHRPRRSPRRSPRHHRPWSHGPRPSPPQSPRQLRPWRHTLRHSPPQGPRRRRLEIQLRRQLPWQTQQPLRQWRAKRCWSHLNGCRPWMRAAVNRTTWWNGLVSPRSCQAAFSSKNRMILAPTSAA